MTDDPVIFDSALPAFTQTATKQSQIIDTDAFKSDTVSFHFWWTDVSITWYLWTSNNSDLPWLSPPWQDITVATRIVDPAWVDPVIGDPLSSHILGMVQWPGRYLLLGWSAANWAGIVGPQLRVTLRRNKR